MIQREINRIPTVHFHTAGLEVEIQGGVMEQQIFFFTQNTEQKQSIWQVSLYLPIKTSDKNYLSGKRAIYPKMYKHTDISPRNKVRYHQGKCVAYMLFSNLVVICPVALLQNRWNLRLKRLYCNLRLDVITGFLSQTVCLSYTLYILCLLCTLQQLKLKMGLCFTHRQQL